MAKLGFNRYGKAEVRLVRVYRPSDQGGDRASDQASDQASSPDQLRDWNVSTSLAGDLSDTHLTGDNSKVLTTDAQKNTVYAFAQRLPLMEPEAFAAELASHYLATQPAISRARIAITEYPWVRIGSAAHSFSRSGGHARVCTVIHDELHGASVIGGIEDLTVLSTTNSEFWGYPKDPYTTLPETTDRMLATQVSAHWRFRDTDVDWAAAFDSARDALLTTFAQTYTYSLQQMLFTIGENILNAVPAICEVRLELPNKHHFLVDLSPFGQPNDNEIYYAADRPYGLIEGQVLAEDAPEPGLAWT